MQGRDAIDRVAAHAREMRHAYVLASRFLNQREAAKKLIVVRKAEPNIVRESGD